MRMIGTNPGPYARAMPSSRPTVERGDPRVRVFPFARSLRTSSRALSGFGDDIAAGEAAIAAVKKAYASGGLHGFACMNCERMLREAKRLGGLGALGLNYQGAASGASAGASVGSAVPVIGTAVGAVVGAIAGALFSKKKDPNAAEKQALAGQLDDYMKVQGSVPGRAFSLTTLKQLIDGAGIRGMWPNVKKWSGDAIQGAIEGCKGCTPPTIRQFVKDQVSGGDIDPISLAGKFTDIVNKTWGSKWFVATAGSTQRQLMIDLMDYFIALEKPDAPLFYAPGWTVAANATAPTPAPAPMPGLTPSGPKVPIGETKQVGTSSSGGLTVYSDTVGQLWTFQNGGWVPYTGAYIAQTAPGTPAVVIPTPPAVTLPVQPPTTNAPPPAVVTPTATQPQIDVQALIKSMMDQGASQQQAFTAALQSLQNQGVQPTPQVQQAVANQVQSAGMFGGVSPWLIGAGVGLTLLSFYFSRPHKAH